MSRVFNAFEQAERSITRQFGGLGLGLAISKALVEMHGGEIEAFSEGIGKGATFRIKLPLSKAASRIESPAAPERGVTRPLHILLVEDHGVTAHMIRMVLTEKGHAVEVAGDVATALEMTDHYTFDLLLSDLGLPDGSGHDLMRELRKRGFRFPGIALSGYGQEDDIRRSYAAGFAAHLTKPASRESVEAAVSSVTSNEELRF
jgi:two-component system CheB/CheR fusion protein